MTRTLVAIALLIFAAWGQPQLPSTNEQESLDSGIWNPKVRHMVSLGEEYFKQNKLDSAANWLDSANRLINRHGLTDTDLVQKTKNTYGIVLAYLQRNVESIKIFEELNTFYLPAVRHPEIRSARAKVLNNIAINYNFLSDYEQAIRYFDSCLVIFKERGLLENEQTQTLYLNKALNQLDLGDYQSAIENVELSSHIRRLQPKSPNSQYALMRENLIYGEVLIEINQHAEDLDEAIKRLEEGLGILTGINPNDFYKGSFLGLLSKAHHLLGNHEKASAYASNTLQFYTAAYGENYTGLIFRYNEFAKIMTARGKTDSAYHFLSKALSIPVPADANKTMYKVETLLQTASLDISQLRTDSIPMRISHATRLLFPEFADSTDILQNPSIDAIPIHPFMGSFFTKKGELLHQLYLQNGDFSYLESAIECYMIAIREGTKSRKGLLTLRSKATYSSLLQNNFSKAMALAHTLYSRTKTEQDFQKILWISDQSKSAILKEHLQGMNGIAIGLPQQVRLEELTMKTNITQLEQAIYSQSSSSQIRADTGAAPLTAQLVAAKMDFSEWLKELEHKYPQYHQMMYGPSYGTAIWEPLHIPNSIRKNRLIIDFFESDDTFYIHYISGRTKRAFAVQKTPRLMDALSRLRRSLKAPLPIGDYQQSALLIFDQLLRPIFDDVSTKNILIIPDGVLSHIPFEVLIDGFNPLATGYLDFQYLIYRHQFSYHHALSLLQHNHRYKITENRSKVFAMAPDYNRDWDGSFAAETTRKGLIKLPHAAKEVALIEDMFPGEYRYGINATESSLKSMAHEANVIHLATHSVIDDADPMKSHLLLVGDTIEDGLLHTYELFSMKVNADLICLSACNSGSGEKQHGEGIISLARGFMYANVPNVLMSLWAVPDQATSIIMQSFYQELKAGESYQLAIHNAKLRYLSNGDEHLANPYYWGAFVYVGNVRETGNGNWWIWLVGISIAGFGGYMLRRKRKADRF